MVGGRGAAAAGLWRAAHEADGALVAGWLRTAVDIVIAIGNIYDETERHALEEATSEISTTSRPL